jgi:hypothetical protein
MERKSFQDMDCPVALALERVGEWWSILILRDATHGITRFDEFQGSLGISPNSLSRRREDVRQRFGPLTGRTGRRRSRRRSSVHRYEDRLAGGEEHRSAIAFVVQLGSHDLAPPGLDRPGICENGRACSGGEVGAGFPVTWRPGR